MPASYVKEVNFLGSLLLLVPAFSNNFGFWKVQGSRKGEQQSKGTIIVDHQMLMFDWLETMPELIHYIARLNLTPSTGAKDSQR